MPKIYPDQIFGDAKAAFHIAGYALERAFDRVETLLKGTDWQRVGEGYKDVNKFLEDLQLGRFELIKEDRKRLAKRIKELQPKATQRAIATALGSKQRTIGHDLEPNGSKKPKKPNENNEATEPSGSKTLSGEQAAKLVKQKTEGAAQSKANREEKHQAIAASAKLILANDGPFPLIYADPPWRWDHFGQEGNVSEAGKGRTPDQHYPTLTYDEIRYYRLGEDRRLVRDIAHKDAALFLWCTSANLHHALEVMAAWGFEYKASAVWVKDKPGLGLVFRNEHELLLYGTRGRMPGPQHQPPSVFHFPRTEHSAKPPEIRKVIEQMYPDFDDLTRLEIFARTQNKGWTCYGFEAGDPFAGLADSQELQMVRSSS